MWDEEFRFDRGSVSHALGSMESFLAAGDGAFGRVPAAVERIRGFGFRGSTFGAMKLNLAF
jgi:hypothetical protein